MLRERVELSLVEVCARADAGGVRMCVCMCMCM